MTTQTTKCDRLITYRVSHKKWALFIKHLFYYKKISFINWIFLRILHKQLQCFRSCLPYFENFYDDSVFLFWILNANFRFSRMSHNWVSTLRALLRRLLTIENCQIFLHRLGISRGILDKILIEFPFSITEIRPFYQKLSFFGLFHRLWQNFSTLCNFWK